ncbi:MAG: hypothetical protein RL701_6230 [Pseudomonadota bacterium]
MLRFPAMTLAVLLCACGQGSSSATPTPSAAKLSTALTVTIPAARDDSAFTLQIAPDRTEIRMGDDVLIGQGKDEKRFYRSAAGEAVLQIKNGDSAFKVRRPDGSLLWKVKISDDKLKISDNEESTNAFVLKTKYDDKVKVLDAAEQALGEVKFKDASGKIKIVDAADQPVFELVGAKRSAAYGVALLRKIPPMQRAVIIAELLAHGH